MTSSPSSTLASGVTAPLGFRAAGVSAGIKANGGLDVALLVADKPATAAAVFTTNRATAAPVIVSRRHLELSGGTTRAIVVNSGCANACTGDEGLTVAKEMAAAVASQIACPVEQVLVASTGVIGVALPIDKIRSGVALALQALGAGDDRGAAAARAIMTTDPFPKEAVRRISVGGRSVAIGGMAKGSGMIEPMMATMLGFVTTDASVPAALLDRALRAAVDVTFNAITVDGECSTNDCVMLLASGASGAVIDESHYDAFVEGLTSVCRDLALGIVRGGEGATKLVTVNVTGAASPDDAKRCAKAIANSPLVKTAIHGGDPNWGRLIAVAGRAGVAFDLSRANVTIGPIVLFENGRPHDENAPQAAAYLTGTDLVVGVNVGAGTSAATVWTCDLSADYVRINADYRT
ncbi:MAG TPA: bifunctional glutamate N-acetyltransferase/amino-acid acetyltransferase ArgJ [Vicinamibacterales bacterium]|jgi:glutamate N-acetyltransferase/amino-acid N-acetyltransferase